MELQGKVIAVLPERSGTSARGEWKVQEYVIETHDSQYPRKLAFEVFGADRIQRFNIQIGQEVLVAFDIDAREWNGRWFNSVRAFDVRPVDPNQYAAQPAPQAAAPIPAAAPAAAPQPAVSAPVAVETAQGNEQEDLPF